MLGMTLAKAEEVGQVTFRSTVCDKIVEPKPGSALEPVSTSYGMNVGVQVWGGGAEPIDAITVQNPALYTISGVHVGSTYDEVRRTYPDAAEVDDASSTHPGSLTIRNTEGRTLTFSFAQDRTVGVMSLGLTPATSEQHSRC